MNQDSKNPITILIVDDSDSNRYVLNTHLSEAGYKIIEASEGPEAIRMFHSEAPSLVLLDVNLPGINGYDICSQLKATPKGSKTPILLISAAFTKEDDHHRGYQEGADAYLVAPINPAILINTVRSWLRAFKVDQDRERLQELTRTITENAASCLFMMDDKGFATYMNPAAELVTGFKLSELGDKALHHYVHHHRTDGSIYPMEECPLGETFNKNAIIREREETFIRKDGSFFPIIYSIAPVMIGDTLTGAVLEFRDISETKKAQQDIETSVEDLRHERDLREQFIATLTHDLRTPLTAAKVSAQLINRKADDPNVIQKLAVRIVDNMDRADQMILDLLDANLINAGEMLSLEMAEEDLNIIISNTIAELSTVHGDRFIYRGSQNLKGHFNSNGIRRVLENLCSNAIKYGEPYKPVVISLEKENSSAKIEVFNEGSIPQAEQKILFNRYARSHAARRSGQKGWGLGLTLVKGIAEAHGGSVSVESSPASGTTFVVFLPLKN